MFTMNKLSLLITAFVLTACTLGMKGMPMNADEARQMFPKSMTGELKTFDVDRSYSQVSKTIEQKAHECFEISVEVTSYGYESAAHWTDYYKPTVIVGDTRTELHLQQHKKQSNLIKPYEEPEGGYYMMVVDVDRISADKVQAHMYVPKFGYDHMVSAIEGWIKGTSSLCPDMAKNDF
jgi:hypothetical protein